MRLQTLSLLFTLGTPLYTASAQAPTLRKDFTIGCAECGGTLQFSNFHEIAVSSTGEVLVADSDSPMLRAFDGTGRPTWSGGRKGRGPYEYQYVLRLSFHPSGAVDVLDMSAMRVTSLAPDKSTAGSFQLRAFATTAGANGRGGLVLGAESPRGGLDLFRVQSGEVTPVSVPEEPRPAEASAFMGASVALAPDGSLAIVPFNERYRIVRLDAAGRPLPEIVREIERVRRTPEEEAALRARRSGQAGAVRAAAEASRGGTSSGAAVQLIPAAELSLKPHLAVDGLRFDPSGRLWVRTMRGDETRQTIFDVFAPSGALLGSVTVEGRIQHFALGGTWLLTAAENDDGVPQVTRWTVR
jgi:hypothetical protein